MVFIRHARIFREHSMPIGGGRRQNYIFVKFDTDLEVIFIQRHYRLTTGFHDLQV